MSQPRETAAATADFDHLAIERAVVRAIRRALLDHKRAGNPIAGLRDGKVVWIAPEDIDIENPNPVPDPTKT